MTVGRGRMRATYDTDITVSYDDKIINSKHTKDISLNGLYVITNEIVPENIPCKIRLSLNNHMSDIKLELTGHIVRSTNEGFAITFDEMDIESYQHLKNIIMYNTEKPDEFLEQCKKRPGFK